MAITTANADEASVIHAIHQLLLDAVFLGASDIHLEPYETSFRIRLRIDGILSIHTTPPLALAARFAARFKILSRLDIAERRLPQDGRFKLKISDEKTIDFRVSTCPTLFGEKVAVRILDPSHTQLNFDTLGLNTTQKHLFLSALQKPQGMVLVTGPTGSGKTISLYAALNSLNTFERNISTCEDPIELYWEGINQVNVNLKAGLTFATALRAFLRQDPDVIMVGEIRDLETAEMAIKAAQTGHLVLSTVHTKSAADTLTRLINMGIPAYHLATSVTLVVAQRLLRLLCPVCKIPVQIPASVLKQCGFQEEELPTLTLFGPKGCQECHQGYKGRIGIYEIMPISSNIVDLILKDSPAISLYQQALREGMWDLRRSGLNKVKQGLTSLTEIDRII